MLEYANRLNDKRASRSGKEYKKDNAEKIKEKGKEYYKDNAEKLKKKITCDCGCILARYHLTRHKKTKKHLDFINQHDVCV